MKLLIASDLHGSAYYARKLVERYSLEKPEKLLFLGDLLYHGPRNDLPRDYAPKEVIPLLNLFKNEILCVRGNCDAEVEEMVLEFPTRAEYALVYVDGLVFYLTHGHIYHEKNPLPMSEGAIFFNGHTHVPAVREHREEGYVYMNPGSLAIPKEGSHPSYMIYEDGVFTWKDVETGEAYMTYEYHKN